MKKYKQYALRPTRENERRLELAKQIGLNVSELLNEALEANFDDLLKRKKRKIQEALEQVPA